MNVYQCYYVLSQIRTHVSLAEAVVGKILSAGQATMHQMDDQRDRQVHLCLQTRIG